MTFEDLHQALRSAFRRARLEAIPFDDVQLDLRSLERVARFGLHLERRVANPFGRYLGPGAVIELRWSAFATARQTAREEDLVGQLLGPKAAMRRTRTQPMSVRLDLHLTGNVVNGGYLPDPGRAAWRRWRAEVDTELGGEEPLVDLDGNDLDEDGNLTLVAWQGEPEARVACTEDGSFELAGLRLDAWQAIPVPRRWDDPSRRPDRAPDLDALMTRWARGIDRWTAALRHLDPGADRRPEA